MGVWESRGKIQSARRVALRMHSPVLRTSVKRGDSGNYYSAASELTSTILPKIES